MQYPTVKIEVDSSELDDLIKKLKEAEELLNRHMVLIGKFSKCFAEVYLEIKVKDNVSE